MVELIHPADSKLIQVSSGSQPGPKPTGKLRRQLLGARVWSPVLPLGRPPLPFQSSTHLHTVLSVHLHTVFCIVFRSGAFLAVLAGTVKRSSRRTQRKALPRRVRRTSQLPRSRIASDPGHSRQELQRGRTYRKGTSPGPPGGHSRATVAPYGNAPAFGEGLQSSYD